MSISTWPEKKLEDCFTQPSPQIKGIRKQLYKSNGRYPVIDQGVNLVAGYTDDSKKVYSKNLPIVVFGDHTRVFKYVDFPFAPGADGVKVLIPNSNFFPKFFYFALQSINLKNLGYSRHFKILRNSYIPVPPIEEQKRIVANLEKILAKINKVEALRVDSEHKIEDLWSSTLKDKISKSFGKEVLLTEVTDFQEGPGILAKDFRPSGVPLVRLRGLDSKRVTLEGCNYLDDEMVQRRWAHFRLKKGDLLLTTSASLGHVSEVTDIADKAIAYTGIIRFRIKNNLLVKDYLKYFFSSDYFKAQVRDAAAGGVIKHFGPTHLKRMTINLPSIEEQERVVRYLDSLNEKVQKLKKLQEEQHRDFDTIHTSILRQSSEGKL